MRVRTGVVVPVATPISAFADVTSVTVHKPEITISPLPKREVELMVLMFVPETSVACFASRAVCVDVEIGKEATVLFLLAPPCTIGTKSAQAGVTVASELILASAICRKLRNYSCSPGCIYVI